MQKTDLGSHLDDEARGLIRDLVAKVRCLEEQWWARLQKEGVPFIGQLKDKGYEPASMRFYGELLFVLLGLKPAVLFTGFEEHNNVMQDYIDCVLIASGLLSKEGTAGVKLSSLVELQSGFVNANFETSYYNFKGSFIICSTSNSGRCVALAQQMLQNAPATISEEQIARLLDYPVALREGKELEEQQRRQPQMVEVGYFHIPSDHQDGGEPVLVTSFGAEKREVNEMVIPHFQQYRAACSCVGFRLAFSVTELS